MVTQLPFNGKLHRCDQVDDYKVNGREELRKGQGRGGKGKGRKGKEREGKGRGGEGKGRGCLLYTSPSPRDLSTSRMPSSA